MGHLDVLRSLVREVAVRGTARLGARDLGDRLERFVTHAVSGVVGVEDAELTAAAARVAGVTAATVTTELGAVHLDVALDDGRSLALRLAPHAAKFAPAGAKEIAMHVDPADAANDPRVRELFAALAGAVARALWRPALRHLADVGPSAFVTHEGGCLALDLRTVPEVSAALRTRLGAVVIDVVGLRAIEARPGGLTLRLALPTAWR